MQEIWKDIPNYEGKYQVSNFGQIRKITKNGYVICHQFEDKTGYKRISLYKNGIQRYALVHRVVGFVFVPGYDPNFRKEINHKDGNKSNNNYENLEWITRSENMLHAVKMGLTNNVPGGRDYLFYQFDKNGKAIRKWGSINDCAFYLSTIGLGIEKEIKDRIYLCLENKIKSCCGFYFSYGNKIDLEEKQIDYHQKPVVAIPCHTKGYSTKEEDVSESEKVHFSGVNDTEGYIMPNGKTAYASLVSKCCLGKRNSHAGYHWRYESDEKGTWEGKNEICIYQFDLDKKLVRVWDGVGIVDISHQLDFATYTGIIQSLREGCACHGFYFSYSPKFDN